MSEEMNVATLMDELLGEQESVGTDDAGENEKAVTTEESPAGVGSEDKSENDDFGDMPNGKIRYEKLQEKFAKLEGIVEQMNRQSEPEEEVSDDEYLTDEEKRERERDEELEAMKAEVNALKKDKIKAELKKKDDEFYDNHLELKKDRANHSKEMLKFIRTKPGLMKDLYENTISLELVHRMMGGSTGNIVQDPKKVFGSTENATPARKKAQEVDMLAEYEAALRNPNSTNKAEAVDGIVDSIVEDMMLA